MRQFQFGIHEGEAVCDLEYVEVSISRWKQDNERCKMMEDGRMIEVLGTAED